MDAESIDARPMDARPMDAERGTPEGILQFGTGRFLRGFADAFVHEANLRAGGASRERTVTAIESTGSGMADRLSGQGCSYRLLVRGIEAGATIDTSVTVTSIERAIDARTCWDLVLQAAVSPHLRTVISNATEAGYALDDGGEDPATGSFPAKLLAVLIARARADLPGLVILPCELVERNGDRLRDLVMEQAARQATEPRVIERIREMTTWGVTLVDRIVTAPGPGVQGAEGDPLAVAAEPFASWVVEIPPDAPLMEHPAIRRTADVGPFALRKIRILNGAHSALVARCRGSGIVLVREAMADADIAAWLQELLTEEIVPALGDRIEDGAAFARTTLDRFRNPFLDHRLADIALHHETKLQTRLVPTFGDYQARFGRRPRLLGRLLHQEGALA
jgi:tagaturonate reductase